MGNVIRKRINFRNNQAYIYEEKHMYLSERRVISVHLFQRKPDDKSKSPNLPYKNRDKTLFFIHGVGGNSEIWWRQIEFFVDLNFTVISIDLLGHGSSQRSHVFSDYEFHKLANDCLSIFDIMHSKSGSNILIGHSYGCSMATYIAHDRQNLVSRLVLMSGGSSKPLGDPDGIFTLTSCCLWCIHPIVLSVFRCRAVNSLSNNFSDRFLSVNIDSWSLKAVLIGQVWDEGDTDYHKKINIPTLLIHGEEDQMVVIEDEWDMLNALPKCLLKTIPGAGHMVMLQAPNEVNNAILYHISRNWESLQSIPKPKIIPNPGQSMTNQSSSKLFRSYSLFTKSSKSNLKVSNVNASDFINHVQEDLEISNRKTLPSGLLIRRKSTRLSVKRANSRRRMQLVSYDNSNMNNTEISVQDTIVEERNSSQK